MNADANVPTPAGSLPSLSDFEKVPGALLSGTEQGIRQFVSDPENPSQLSAPGANPIADLIANPAIQQLIEPVLFGGGFGFSLPTEPSSDSLLSIVNALTGAASSGYAALLPTADIANALLVSLPAYDADIFFDQLAGGNLIDAIGLPIAAGVGLLGHRGDVRTPRCQRCGHRWRCRSRQSLHRRGEPAPLIEPPPQADQSGGKLRPWYTSVPQSRSRRRYPA